ncbi:MAG: 16S rRNA (adenine(1518)-N(6)/adenine(1519)-N(6))-dimethyltransferase RsmA [Bacteroidota bacterium]
MKNIQPKKSLGQHFLQDSSTAQAIVSGLDMSATNQVIIEIGPGIGALTDWLITTHYPLFLVEIDARLIPLLKRKYGEKASIIEDDFLTINLSHITKCPISLIGSFPYNISSQLFFAILANKKQIDQVVCMVQEEVALRITARSGSKAYGLLSVLLQAFYETSYLFQVAPESFNPPPNVLSGVIKLTKRGSQEIGCDEEAFFKVVKAGFQQRRKMLRNSLRILGKSLEKAPNHLLEKRAEALTVADFVKLTQLLFSDN